MLKQFTDWLFALVKESFTALLDLLKDFFVAVVDLIAGAVVGLLSLIPVPEFMASGLGGLFGQLDSGILFFLSAMGLPQGLAIIGTAYLFRLGRKVATLFQW